MKIFNIIGIAAVLLVFVAVSDAWPTGEKLESGNYDEIEGNATLVQLYTHTIFVNLYSDILSTLANQNLDMEDDQDQSVMDQDESGSLYKVFMLNRGNLGILMPTVHAQARVRVLGLYFCLSTLNLLRQGSRATIYYTHMFLTMNARFNMCAWSSIKTYGSKLMKKKYLPRQEHKQIDLT